MDHVRSGLKNLVEGFCDNAKVEELLPLSQQDRLLRSCHQQLSLSCTASDGCDKETQGRDEYHQTPIFYWTLQRIPSFFSDLFPNSRANQYEITERATG